MAGSALLEVAIAMLLLSGATVAVLGAQLAMRRMAADSAARMTALRLADSYAELMRSGVTQAREPMLASADLPDVRIASRTLGGHEQVEVRWSRRGDAAPPARCDAAASTCVVLAFSAGVAR